VVVVAAGSVVVVPASVVVVALVVVVAAACVVSATVASLLHAAPTPIRARVRAAAKRRPTVCGERCWCEFDRCEYMVIATSKRDGGDGDRGNAGRADTVHSAQRCRPILVTHAIWPFSVIRYDREPLLRTPHGFAARLRDRWALERTLRWSAESSRPVASTRRAGWGLWCDASLG
jgi:hypothetical protein